MQMPARTSLQRLRRRLAYALAGVLILMALVGGITAQLLPWLDRHPDKVAAWLESRAQRPVSFDHLQTRWTRRGPLLQMRNLRIGDHGGVVVGDAEILVSQYGGLLPGRSFTELRLRGLELTLQRDASGRWQVRGLPGQQATNQGDPLDVLERLGELQVIGATLGVDAPALGIRTRLEDLDLRLRVDGSRVRAGARARDKGDSAWLQAVLDFDRHDGGGRAWLQARPLDLGKWSSLLDAAGVSAASGNGTIQVWATLADHRVLAAVGSVMLDDVSLRGADAVPPARHALGRVEGTARWRLLDQGWRLDVERLRIGAGTAQHTLDGLLVAGGARYALRADRIDVAPLLRVVALSDRLQPGLRRWLQAADPRARLLDVELAGERGGRMRAHARVQGFGFAAVGGAPGLEGLAGSVDGDAQGMTFQFDPRVGMVFRWPHGFGVDHPLRLGGSVTGWREGAGWKLETPALHVIGSDYSADVRGGLWFQGDGTRPWIDIAAQLGPAPVTASRKFWMHHTMSPRAIHWLDNGLIGGRVVDGRAVVFGDLDDWPFLDNDGLFHASARLVDAAVKFQPDWPAAEHINGDVDFVGNGFSMRGSASLGGVPVDRIEAGIERFSHSELKVSAATRTGADKLLELLRRSPLQKEYGQTLDQLDIAGPASVQYALDLPLHPDAPAGTMQGKVALDGARLHEREWKLLFEQARGEAAFDQNGFAADALQVQYAGHPARLSLRAGGHTRDSRHGFEGDLLGRVDADALLDHAPNLAWLKPHVQGVSDWTVTVALPRTASAGVPPAPSTLQLHSNLVGTRLDLPAPLDKAAAQALPTTVSIGLPMDKGDIDVGFGKLLALRARNGNGGSTGMRVEFGSSQVSGEVPASGIVVAGRSERLDAIDWGTLTQGSKAGASADNTGSGSGLALRGADVMVGKLQLIGSTFPETRLRLSPAGGGTRVRLDGAALAGNVMLPQADGAPISADLERLYWRSATAAAASPATAPAAADPGQPAPDGDVDPAKIPPLHIKVADLRFGDAVLGNTVLRTRRTPAGMRIEQLQAHHGEQVLDITGDWTGVGSLGATRLDARLQTGNMGALLSGFGFGNQISKGAGSLHLQAGWPGGPAGFNLAGLQGQMRLDLRNGQLVEVEPGAGRVLGLLSLTQLPRRLALDFRDFFSKGFAFNSIDGDVAFEAGQARTDNLAIKGPAAEIGIRGAANLVAQTYDQTIDVHPRTGNLLTVAGALAGGPVGAAIGAAANAVLNKPLGNIGAKTYRVTGPWKEPKVEVISRQTPAASPVKEAAATTMPAATEEVPAQPSAPASTAPDDVTTQAHESASPPQEPLP